MASNNIHISIGMLPPRTMSIDVCSAPLECVVRSTGPQAKHYTIAVAGRADETDAHVRPISALLRSFHGPLHLFGVGSFRAKSIDVRIGTSLSALSLYWHQPHWHWQNLSFRTAPPNSNCSISHKQTNSLSSSLSYKLRLDSKASGRALECTRTSCISVTHLRCSAHALLLIELDKDSSQLRRYSCLSSQDVRSDV